LRRGVRYGVCRGETVRRKIARQGTECFSVALLQRCSVSNENRLVVLRSPREKRCHKRDAYSSSLVPKEVGNARSFVVLVLRQIRVGELADRHEEGSDADSLERSKESNVLVVGSEINAGIPPHGKAKMT